MSVNEWGIILAAGGVVVGVVLEGWEHWDNFTKKGWKPVIPKIGFAILVISLAVEIVFDALLAKEAANTELKAAQLQKAVAWRQLSPEQSAKIASALKKYAGQKVSVFAYNGDLEAWTFASQIEIALGGKDGAGWDVHFARIMWSRLTTSGILVETTKKASKKDRQVAKGLLDALNSQGLNAFLPPTRIPEGEDMKDEVVEGDPGDTVIWVTVGVHPRPISGQ